MTEQNAMGKEKEMLPDSGAGHPFRVLFLTTITVLFSVSVGAWLMVWWGSYAGVDPGEAMRELSGNARPEDRFRVRVIAGINQVFTFLLPALITAVFLARKQWKSFLGFRSITSLNVLVKGVLFILAAYPVAQVLYWLNLQVTLPDWLADLEKMANQAIYFLLSTDRPEELLQNILLIGLLPALGEEFLFRGILQKQLMRWTQNPAFAIWLAAIVFSTIHFQFQGFLPRAFLGAVLGYLFWWTNNLWIPVVAHFLNNSMQVVVQFLFRDEFDVLQSSEGNMLSQPLEPATLILGLFSGIVLVYLGRKLKTGEG